MSNRFASKPVALVRCDRYDTNEVLNAVASSVELLGGIERFVKRGDKVLIKPNMLLAAAPERAVCTHPEVVRAAIRLAKDAGASEVWVGDSPGVGKTATVARKSGIGAVVEEEGAKLVEFKHDTELVYEKGVFKRFEVATEVVEADAIINLPKAKTHSQMVLTLAVKNLFGCVVGKKKPGWHLKAGSDYGHFARMLLDLHYAIAPRLNILDAIVGMEGDGPSNGSPATFGFIGASEDALSLDLAVAHIFRVDPARVFVLAEASKEGFGLERKSLEIRGEPIEELRLPRPVKLPALFDLRWNVPAFLRGFITRHLVARPVPDHDACTLCRECQRVCPPGAISVEDRRISIDYEKCIRCYCCQEVCPTGAMKVRRSFVIFS